MLGDTRIPNASSGNVLAVVTLLLIFLAIAAYGGEHVWQEAAFLTCIFVVTGLTFATRSADPRSLPLRLFLPLLLLSAYSFLQGVTPLILGDAGTGYIGSVPYAFDATGALWNGVKMMGSACLLAICLISLRRGSELFVKGLILVGGFFAALGIGRLALQYYFPEFHYYVLAPELGPNVGFGTFLNQNHFALLMLMTLGLSISPLREGEILRSKKLFLVVGVLAWIATVLTASRGGIIGSFLVVVTLIVFGLLSAVARYRREHVSRSKLIGGMTKSLAAAILIMVALVVAVFLVGQGRVLQRFEELPEQIEETSGLGFRRPDVWQATTKLIQEHYVYGTGFGGFRYAVPEYINISGAIVPYQAHNDYLEFVASGGIVSCALLIWFICVWLLETRKSRRRSPGKTLSVSAIGAVCGIVGAAFHSLADFGLQYVGNLAFFIALIAIVISPDAGQPDPEEPSPTRSGSALRIASALTAIVLCAACVMFGYSRYLLVAGPREAEIQRSIGIPFDAEYHSALAHHLITRGEADAAVRALRVACRLRNQDHHLWLRLARLEATAGDPTAAEEAFQKAIKLAPLYGEPHFWYGSFLLDLSRNAEGVTELVFAARRDKRFTDTVLDLIWGRTADLPQHLEYLITGRDSDSNTRITRFLLAKGEYELITDLSCRALFSDIERDMLVRQLLERRAVRSAWRVYTGECIDTDAPPAFINGGFETSDLTRGLRFGWVVGESLTKDNLSLDRTSTATGQQSLRLRFDENVRPPFLKQLFPVRRNSRYTVSFFYKSRGILSGGAPIVQIVLRRRGSEARSGEVELSVEKPEWEKRTISFETDENTEAVELIVTSRPCPERTCPIFGELWLDSFEIFELSQAADSAKNN